ncbi:MAG: hypothetical protein COA79_04585 [Planctomycetota bacterium]|nr:MAG: hypothetical protein COA79_04585 [Planctomycetota bacterium]
MNSSAVSQVIKKFRINEANLRLSGKLKINCIEDQTLPLWWKKIPENKPVVFISLSSFCDEKTTLNIVEKLSKMEVTVLLDTEYKIIKKDITYNNVFTSNCLPRLAIAERADLFICNGDIELVYLGLSQSTPILCIPILMDQLLVSNAIVKKGIGLMIRSSTLTDKKVLDYTNKLLVDKCYQEQASKFSKTIEDLNSLEANKNIIYRQLKPKRRSGNLTRRLNQIALVSNKQDDAKGSQIELKIASSVKELNEAYKLVYRQYLEKGFTAKNDAEKRILFWNTLPDTYTVIAKQNDRVIGTLTFIKDSVAGLPMDDISKNSLEPMRKEGRVLCELTGLAIDGSACEKSTVMKLFQFGFKLSSSHLKSTDYVITINPRHQFFYKKVLCFEIIGSTCSYKKVENAPAVPMRLNLLTVENMYLKKYAKYSGDKNLNDYFFKRELKELDLQIKNEIKIRDNKLTCINLYRFFMNKVSAFNDSSNRDKFYQLWSLKFNNINNSNYNNEEEVSRKVK